MAINRSAPAGDTFILLAPFEESAELQAHRQRLQKLIGGTPVLPVHFTCQRFMFQDERLPETFMNHLKLALCDMCPFPIQGVSLTPLYSQFRKARVLKWRIAITEPLDRFSTIVEKVLLDCGGKSLYPARWLSTLITALEDIEGMNATRSLDEVGLPNPLFLGEQVILSRYAGHGKFDILETFPLPRKAE